MLKVYNYIKYRKAGRLGYIGEIIQCPTLGHKQFGQYILCDGSSLSKRKYKELYTVIGNLYNTGINKRLQRFGWPWFNLPKLS